MNNEKTLTDEQANCMNYLLFKLKQHTRILGIDSEEEIRQAVNLNKVKWVREFIASTK